MQLCLALLPFKNGNLNLRNRPFSQPSVRSTLAAASAALAGSGKAAAQEASLRTPVTADGLWVVAGCGSCSCAAFGSSTAMRACCIEEADDIAVAGNACLTCHHDLGEYVNAWVAPN